MGPTKGTGKAAVGIGLVALVALGAVLRLGGMDKLQPHLQEADSHVVLQMQMHRSGRAAREQLPAAYYQYPTMLARALAWVPEAQMDAAEPAGESLERSLALASADIVRVRTAVALLSILLIPLTWLLARRFLGGAPALLAAALVTFSVLHLLFSQQARMHGPQATCALATVLVAMRMRARPGFGIYLAGAGCFALALGFLHNGAAALLPLLAAHALRDRAARFPWWGAALLFAPAAAVYWLFYPSPPTLQGAGEVVEFGGHTLPLGKLDGSGFVRVARYLWDYEPALLVASALGLAAGLVAAVARRGAARDVTVPGRPGDLLVAGSYALPYLAAIGVMGLTQDRFLIPLLPFLACLAAWPLALLRAKPALAWALALVALAFPAFVTLRYVQLRGAPDTVEQAAQWVRAHVPAAGEPAAGRVVTSARLALPLLHSPEALRTGAEDYATRKTMWLGWQTGHLPLEEDAPFAGGPRWNLFLTPGKLLNMNQERGRADVEAWLARADADYAVLEVSRLMAFIPGAALLREVIAERGELLAELRGEDPRWCAERPLDYQEVPAFVPRLLAASAFGPCIEIYRLER